jgi:hypothetical protein
MVFTITNLWMHVSQRELNRCCIQSQTAMSGLEISDDSYRAIRKKKPAMTLHDQILFDKFELKLGQVE